MPYINVDQVLAKQYFAKYEGTSEEVLHQRIFDKSQPLINRCVYFIELVVHHTAYFNKLSYTDKISLLEPHFSGTVFCTSKEFASSITFLEYICKLYIANLKSDSDIINVTQLVVQRKSVPATIISYAIKYIRNSAESITFLRKLCKDKNQEAALLLAEYKHEEDVCVLSCLFIKNCLGRALPQFTHVEEPKESTIPPYLLRIVLSYLADGVKIHSRIVCKKWFNELNSDGMWQDMCKNSGFKLIPRFNWTQSYFLQKYRVVKINESNEVRLYNIEPSLMIGMYKITEIFPHPQFLSLLFLYSKEQTDYLLQSAVANYSAEDFLEFIQAKPSYHSFVSAYYVLIKSNLHVNPIFSSMFLSHLEVCTRGETFMMLYRERKDELIAALIHLMHSQRDFSKFLNSKGEYYESLMTIILKEEKLYEEWKKRILQLSDTEKYNVNTISLITQFVKDEEKAVSLLTELLNTTDHFQFVPQCISGLAHYKSGIPVLQNFLNDPLKSRFLSVVTENLQQRQLASAGETDSKN